MNNKMKVMFGLMSATICLLIINMISDRQAYANTATNMNEGGGGAFVADTINLKADTWGFEIMHAADFNQDGFDDLLIFDEPSNGEKSYRVYLNDGNTFAEAWRLTESECGCPSFSTHDFTPADVNNDGYPDIISASQSNEYVLVYINQLGSGLACNTDLNDDGTVNITDLLVLIADWGDCS